VTGALVAARGGGPDRWIAETGAGGELVAALAPRAIALVPTTSVFAGVDPAVDSSSVAGPSCHGIVGFAAGGGGGRRERRSSTLTPRSTTRASRIPMTSQPSLPTPAVDAGAAEGIGVRAMDRVVTAPATTETLLK